MNLIKILVTAYCCLCSASVLAIIPFDNVEDLLEMVEKGRIEESQEHKSREARFLK